MKQLFILLFLASTLPLPALNAAPTHPGHESILQIYSADKNQNARQAVRLGNENFHRRINTAEMTSTDTQIALLITTGFKPFFEKLDKLEENALNQNEELSVQYQQEFQELVIKFSKLLLKNQLRYTNSLLIDKDAAAQEALLIVQEAITQGRF